MGLIIRLIAESFRFAWNALKENLLRTMLSLLGVTVGIFSIISVLTAVDGLDKGIKKSLNFLGEKVIYVEKWPWIFSESYPWWKYFQRPEASAEEYEYLKSNITWAQAVSIFDIKGGLTFKYRSNSVRATSMGISYEHNQVASIPIADGRYFSPTESSNGKYVMLIGHNIANDLFQGADPIGKDVKVKDLKFRVIGVLEKQGDNLLNAPSNDDLVMIPYKVMVKLFSSGRRGISPTIAAKGLEEDKGMVELENEIRGMMRRYRGQRPKEEDSFALNRPEMFGNFFDGIIGVLNIAGFVIGGFGILIGGFGIANIMFVSVKERTNLIGIQKSLGAKNYFILLQFLLEAVFLSLFGGISGLSLVYLLEFIPLGDSFSIELSTTNMVTGVVISSVIGVLSGIIPAINASRMDPVEAIRSN